MGHRPIINNLFDIVKWPVRAALLTNVTLSGEQTLDGVALKDGDDFGAFGQTTSADRGIYVVKVGAWERRNDADSFERRPLGMCCYVREGTLHAQSVMTQTARDTYETSPATGAYVEGPSGGATDDAIARFDTTTGVLLQNSVVTVDDAGVIAGLTGISGTGALTADATGRAVVADGFFTANEVSTAGAGGKFAANSITQGGVDHLFDTDTIGEDRLVANEINGRVMASVADDNVIGGVPLLHRIDITAGALGDTDVTLTHKTRVIDAWLVLRGAGVATTTLQVKNGNNAITDAMAASGSDTDLVRAASIDDANHEIAAAGTLRVTSLTGAGQPDATVYVLGIRVA